LLLELELESIGWTICEFVARSLWLKHLLKVTFARSSLVCVEKAGHRSIELSMCRSQCTAVKTTMVSNLITEKLSQSFLQTISQN
jgi:hypothetical protein